MFPIIFYVCCSIPMTKRNMSFSPLPSSFFFNWACSPPSFSFHGFFLLMAIFFFKVQVCSWTCLHVCYKVVIAITKLNSQANLSFKKNWACLPSLFFILFWLMVFFLYSWMYTVNSNVFSHLLCVLQACNIVVVRTQVI